MAAIPAGAGSLLGKRLGKYEILALLALGGTAEIYLARIGGAAGFEKYVVVKCLHDHLADDQEFVKMFLDEARLAAHLDHSNIVQTFELGEYENRYYMVMEFLAGLSLAMIVRRAGERLSGGRLPVPLVLNIVAQACAGLHYSHEKTAMGKPLNIVHRDISPQNLVVSFEGVVKVVDYGIAKAEHRETRTRSGTIKGKFAYMSPEQCVANNVDRRTDVFALGVIAHELLTGRRLFKRPSPYETYQAVIECNVQPPSSVNHELDPTLDAVIMKSVAKDKEHRYPTAEAFGDALQSYLHHRGKGSGPGDVGRFLEEKFAIEIDEHGQRMRELIAGRPADTGNWDEDEEPKPKDDGRDIGNETVDYRKQARMAGGESSMILETGDIEEVRPSEASLESEVARISRGQRADSEGGSTDVGAEPSPDGDDMPADRTRIETNPLERLEGMGVSPGSGAGTKPIERPSFAGPRSDAEGHRGGPIERPSMSDMSQNHVAPLPAPPTGPVRAAGANDKFPDAANLPTMIAELEEEPPPAAKPIGRVTPGAIAAASRSGEPPTVQLSRSMQHAAVQPPRGYTPPVMTAQPPPLTSTPASATIVPGAMMAQMGSPPSMSAQMPVQAPPLSILQAQDYPQVPPDFTAQQALLERETLEAQQAQAQAQADYAAQMQAYQQQYPSYPDPQQQQQAYDGQYNNGYDPNQQQGYPPVDPAQMMSPVGEHYPQVDWAQAAAAPVRVVPPWMLALIFVGALGVALLVTFLIAMAVR